MIRFLDGRALGAELPEFCRASKEVRIAVAFWGEGAVDALGSGDGLERVRIVCNLRSGGTNPDAIRRLVAAGASVKHSDELHAKLYLFDTQAVIGSSNVSANGLSYQGHEATGWTEANVLFDRASGPYTDAERQFDAIWRTARLVKHTDLDSAQEAWSRRRRLGLAGRSSNGSDLISELATRPEFFADQRIFLTVDRYYRSASSELALETERKRLDVGDELDCWEDWEDMPKDATFVSFMRGPRGGVKFDGFWHSPERRREIRNKDGELLQLVDQLDDVKGIKRVGDLIRWKMIIELALQESDEDGTVIFELGALVRKHLSQ